MTTQPDLYRNRDFIPDFDALMAETAARSRALAARSRMRRDLPYGPSARQRFDLVLPEGETSDAPLHVFIHGGYWRAGNKDVHTLVAAPVLAVGGITAVIGYDLMPDTRLGDIVAQVRAGLRHIAGLAGQIGADPARLTVSGHSAGAHLAALLAARAPADAAPPHTPDLRGLLLVSGIYDLSGIPDSFLKDEAKMTHAEAAGWSPLEAEVRPVPRCIVTRGSRETAPFQEQAEAYAKRLAQAGAEVECRQEPDRNHLDIVFDLGDPESALGRRLADLVAG
jgi:arylformamidase